MPLPPDFKKLSKAEQRRLLDEELARRAPKEEPQVDHPGMPYEPGLLSRGFGGAALTALQRGAGAALEDDLGATPSGDLTGVEQALRAGFHGASPTSMVAQSYRQAGGEALSPVLGAIQQSANPLLMGEVGERAMQKQDTSALREVIGDSGVAGLQTAGSMVPQLAMRIPGAGTVGKIASLRQALPVIGRQMMHGELVSGLQGMLGAEEGHRGQAAIDAMLDPTNIALNAVGAGVGVLGGIQAHRAGQPRAAPQTILDPSVLPDEVMSERLRPKKQQKLLGKGAIITPPPEAPLPDAANPFATADDSFNARVEENHRGVVPEPFTNDKTPVGGPLPPVAVADQKPDGKVPRVLLEEHKASKLTREDVFGSPETIAARIRATYEEALRKLESKHGVGSVARLPPDPRLNDPTISKPIVHPAWSEFFLRMRDLSRLPEAQRMTEFNKIVDFSFGRDVAKAAYIKAHANLLMDPSTPPKALEAAMLHMGAMGEQGQYRTRIGAPIEVGEANKLLEFKRFINQHPDLRDKLLAKHAPVKLPPVSDVELTANGRTNPGGEPLRMTPISAEVEVTGDWHTNGQRGAPPPGEVTTPGGVARVAGQKALPAGSTPRTVNPYLMRAGESAAIPVAKVEQAARIAARRGQRIEAPIEVPYEKPQRQLYSSAPARLAHAIRELEEAKARLNPKTAMSALEGKAPLDVKSIRKDPVLNTVATRAWKEPGQLQKLRAFFKLPEDRWDTPAAVSDAIRQFNAGRRLRDITLEQIHPKIEKAMKGLSKEQKGMVERYVRQNLRPEDVENNLRVPWEALPSEIQNIFAHTFEQNTKKRNVLIENGYFTPEQIKYMKEQDAAGRQWMHADYLNRMVKGWKPKPEVYSRAVTKLTEKMNVSEEQARGYLNDLLRGEGTVQERIQNSPISNQVLKGRAKLPWWLREVLGEIHDPAYVVANSAAELDALYQQHQVSQAFLTPDTKGIFWSDTPMDHLDPSPVGGKNMDPMEGRRQFGGFHGKYLHPALKEAVSAAPTQHVANEAMGAAQQLMSMFRRSKTLWSPVTFMRNWFGNAQYLVAADVPWWNGPKFYNRFKQAAKAMTDYRDAVYGAKVDPNTNAAGWVRAALEYGAISPGKGSDLGGSAARRIAQRVSKKTDGTAISAMEMYWDEANGKLGDAYEALDKHARMMAFIEQTEQGIVKLGLDQQSAYKRASTIVNENFASGSNVGKGLRQASTGMVGALAPFMSWHADNLRVHMNWMRRGKLALGSAVDGNFKEAGTHAAVLARIGLHQAALLAVIPAVARVFSGMSDEEVAVADAMMKDGYGSRNPYWAVFPVRDSEGRLQLIPLDSMSASATFLRGSSHTDGTPGAVAANLATRIAGNAAFGFFDGGLSESPVAKLLLGMGMNMETFKDPDPLPGEESEAAMKLVYDFFEPGAVGSASRMAHRTMDPGVTGLSQYSEKLSVAQGLTRFTPFGLEPVGKHSMAGEEARLRAKSSQAQKAQGTINKKRTGETQEEQDRLRRSAQEAQARVISEADRKAAARKGK